LREAKKFLYAVSASRRDCWSTTEETSPSRHRSAVCFAWVISFRDSSPAVGNALPALRSADLAAGTVAGTPGAVRVRLLQTVVDASAEANSTLVMPFPVEMLRFFEYQSREADGDRIGSRTRWRGTGGTTGRHITCPWLVGAGDRAGCGVASNRKRTMHKISAAMVAPVAGTGCQGHHHAACMVDHRPVGPGPYQLLVPGA
jgi:hypothetical protein